MCNWNLKPSLSCHVCNSTASCGQELTNVDEFKRICAQSKRREADQCYAVVDDQNQIHRGCYAEEQSMCDKFPAKCIKCRHENYCNSQPAMESGLVCYVCPPRDSQCAIERSTMSVTMKCLDHFPGQLESCYDIRDKLTGEVERGCSLDLPRDRGRRINAIVSYCDSHFCNSEGHAVRRCLSCIGTSVNSTCHSLGSAAAVQMVADCRSVLGQMEASSCYTLFWNRTTILRGCQVTLIGEHAKYCTDNLNKFCYLCSNNTCNDLKLWYEKCYVCNYNCTERMRNGTTDTFHPVVTNAKPCENVSTGERNGCYLWRVGKGDWRQGCVADMPLEKYKDCLADGDNCLICTGGSCNNKAKEQPKLIAAIDEARRAVNGEREKEALLEFLYLIIIIFLIVN